MRRALVSPLFHVKPTAAIVFEASFLFIARTRFLRRQRTQIAIHRGTHPRSDWLKNQVGACLSRIDMP